VIVHPVFRATGLATRLVRRMIAECPTPYIEALATMGWVHPFFDRAGMTRIEPDDPDRAVYYYAPSAPSFRHRRE
jgi:N-acetylglutamate synthase-like GNAT family acetyltransferase